MYRYSTENTFLRFHGDTFCIYFIVDSVVRSATLNNAFICLLMATIATCCRHHLFQPPAPRINSISDLKLRLHSTTLLMLNEAEPVFTNFCVKLYYIICYRSTSNIKVLPVIYLRLRMLSEGGFTFWIGFHNHRLLFYSARRDLLNFCFHTEFLLLLHPNKQNKFTYKGEISFKMFSAFMETLWPSSGNFLYISWEAREQFPFFFKQSELQIHEFITADILVEHWKTIQRTRFYLFFVLRIRKFVPWFINISFLSGAYVRKC